LCKITKVAEDINHALLEYARRVEAEETASEEFKVGVKVGKSDERDVG
jgi:hypothetical protein